MKANKIQYLLTVEFNWYKDTEETRDYRCQICTIGVYDTIDEALKHANESIDGLPDMNFGERFTEHGGLWGYYTDLVVDYGDNSRPSVRIKITELKYIDIAKQYDECIKDLKY